jgi:hypothetical protein
MKDIILAFVSNDWKIPRKPPVMKTGLWTDIWTQDL